MLSTVITFLLLTKALSSYIRRMEGKAKTIQRISLLLIASDLVNLFSKSESKNLVDGILQGSGQSDDSMFDSLNSSFGGAGIEIERLYGKITRAYKPSEEISRIRISVVYLRSILLLYGFSVSITQYFIVAFSPSVKSTLFSPAISDMLIATVLFSSIFVYISVYIVYISRRIDTRYSKLQERRNGIHHGAE